MGGHLQGFVFTVGTQVERRAVSELNQQQVLPGVTLRWRDTCGQKPHLSVDFSFSSARTRAADFEQLEQLASQNVQDVPAVAFSF